MTVHNTWSGEISSGGSSGRFGEGRYFVEDYYSESDAESQRDVAAMMRALNAAYVGSEGGPAWGFGEVYLHPAKQYVIPTNQLTVDLSMASLIGGRGTRIRTLDTAGTLCHATASFNRVEGNNSFASIGARMEGIAFYGPLSLASNPPPLTLVGMLCDAPNGAAADLAHVAFKNLLFRGFSQGVKTGSNCHQLSFRNCAFLFNLIGWDTPFGGSNGGERFVVESSCFGDNACHVAIASDGVDLFLHGCSLDYAEARQDVGGGGAIFGKARAFNVGKGKLYMIGGHIEDVNEVDYWGWVGDGSAYVELNGVQLHVGGNKSVYKLFLVQGEEAATSSAKSKVGGLRIRGGHLHFGGNPISYGFTTLHEGKGAIHCEGLTYEDVSAFGIDRPYPAVSKQLSVVRPRVDAAGDLAAWDLTSTPWGITDVPATHPQRDTGVLYDGSPALHILTDPVADGTSIASKMFACRPGQTVLSSMVYRNNLVSRQFSVGFLWFDAAGGYLGASDQLIQAAANTGANFVLLHRKPELIPPEAALGRFYMGGFNWVHGEANHVWIGEVVVNVI